MSPVSVPSYSSESGKVRARTVVAGSLTVLLVFLAIVLLSDPSLAGNNLLTGVLGLANFVGKFLAPIWAVGCFLGADMFRRIARNESDAAETLSGRIKSLRIAGVVLTAWTIAAWFIF